MEINISPTRLKTGSAAAHLAAESIMKAIAEFGEANLILATGASQFEMLAELVRQPVDWSRVTAFHLDEYIGLPETHPASFRKYLKERFEEQVGGLKAFHYVVGDSPDPAGECRRLNRLLGGLRVDLACVGIGENGHLAFNDPPADFEIADPYIIVELDEACRRQQLGEGWFASLDDVPRRAISMSIRQIIKSRRIVCTVPDLRKADAVQKTVEGPVTNQVPASVLQQHPLCNLFLDEASASRLTRTPGYSG